MQAHDEYQPHSALDLSLSFGAYPEPSKLRARLLPRLRCSAGKKQDWEGHFGHIITRPERMKENPSDAQGATKRLTLDPRTPRFCLTVFLKLLPHCDMVTSPHQFFQLIAVIAAPTGQQCDLKFYRWGAPEVYINCEGGPRPQWRFSPAQV